MKAIIIIKSLINKYSQKNQGDLSSVNIACLSNDLNNSRFTQGSTASEVVNKNSNIVGLNNEEESADSSEVITIRDSHMYIKFEDDEVLIPELKESYDIARRKYNSSMHSSFLIYKQ